MDEHDQAIPLTLDVLVKMSNDLRKRPELFCEARDAIPEPYRILFLDFDGVLHPFPPPADPSQLFCNLPRLEAVLRDFVDVRIVISSSWREDRSLADLAGLFSPDIAPRVIGVLPVIEIKSLADMVAVRYREIQQFLAGLPAQWVALDDDPSLFPPVCPQLLHCEESGFDCAAELMLRHRFSQVPEREPGQQIVFGSGITLEELPHMEIRALAMIGAGLLKKNKGNPKAINKLLELAVPIDGYYYNWTLKTLAALGEVFSGVAADADDTAWLEHVKTILEERRKRHSGEGE